MPEAQGRGASDRPLGGRAPPRVRAGARRRSRAGARPLGGRLRGPHRARAALHALTAGRGARLLGVRRRAAPGAGMPVSEEARLVERLQGGDASALEALMSEYATRVYRLALRLTQGQGGAGEVVPDGFLAVAAQCAPLAGRPAPGGRGCPSTTNSA